MEEGMNDWQAQQQADECARMQAIEDTLCAAMCRPLTEQEIRLLASETGIGENYMNLNPK